MNARHDELSAQLQQALQWRPPALRFDPVDEAHFHASCAPARLTHFMHSGAIALMAYLMFLLTDQRMIPDVYEQAFAVRVYGFTPLAALILGVGVLMRPTVLRLPSALLEGAVVASALLAAVSLAWLLTHSRSPCAGMYTAGLLPIVVYGNLVQRFRFPFALVFSVLVSLISAGCAYSRHGRALPYEVFDAPLVLLITVVAGYTLVMNYRLELEERKRFQGSVRGAQLLQKLSASKAQLDELARRDPLTGVPNRRHVEAYLREHWSHGHVHGQAHDQPEASALAVLLLDVDHFKAFNDRYGHPAGDQCLKHVAEVLQKTVPTSQGCVARWGGEEFMVVLPATTPGAATAMAQALCQAVHHSALRHERSSTAGCVTISVGLALQAGEQLDPHADALVARADRALYRAKHAGRNRAVLDEATPLAA